MISEAFIDGSNTYFAQKKMGKWLDWELRKVADKFFYLEDLVELTKDEEFVRI